MYLGLICYILKHQDVWDLSMILEFIALYYRHSKLQYLLRTFINVKIIRKLFFIIFFCEETNKRY